MEARDKTILCKMFQYCEEIQTTHRHFGNSEQLFFDRKGGFIYRNSIAMPILQIGELAKNLSREFLCAHPAVPWKAIMRMRDFFAHHYGSVDYHYVWETAHSDIDALKAFLTPFVR